MRLLLTVILLLSLTACVSTLPPTKTVIHDQAEAELLLGKHLFTEAGLTSGGTIHAYEVFGRAKISDDNGTYRVTGKQEERWDGHRGEEALYGYVTLEGIITEINTLSFIFEGDVETYSESVPHERTQGLEYIQGPSTRRGQFIFSREKHPAYWRLQQVTYMSNIQRIALHDPDSSTSGLESHWDYIDIFSQHLTEDEK